ncbi:MAG: lipopolysaccharide biosynthesis protein, partial [Pseudomonadota bacterium]
MPLVVSTYVRPLLPAALTRRFGAQVERGLETADAIVAGRDERAISQRTALLAFSIRIVSAFIAYVSQVLMA